MGPVTVYLGLGSNLGKREENLAEAVRLLETSGDPKLADPADGGLTGKLGLDELEITRVSSVYETSPWGYKHQPDFLNCVLEGHTNLAPAELLKRVKEVERTVGRQPSVRYGPRLIDVDILLYGDDIVDHPDLQIPHPRLHQRAFVLVPLAELRPGLIHPIQKTTIGGLASKVDELEGVRLWGPLLIIRTS